MRNELLAALRAGRPRAVGDEPLWVHLTRQQVLCRHDTESAWAYFPAGALVSHALPLPDGTLAHVSLTGFEGLVGEPALSAVHRACLTDAIVTVPGGAWRLPADVLRAWYDSDGRTRAMLDRYAECRLAETAINAACVALHSVERRVCCTLLKIGDRTGDRIPMTHRLLAFIVGTTRPTVTRVLDELAKRRNVAIPRGGIAILNRAALVSSSCECYARTAAHVNSCLHDLRQA